VITPAPRRIRQVQIEALDTIKRHLVKARKPSPIIEEYRALLAPVIEHRDAGKLLKKLGKKRAKSKGRTKK
jgi:hypothetical protein